MQRNTLPLALALVQPDETVGDDFEEWELTVNQGIHGLSLIHISAAIFAVSAQAVV